MKTRTLVALVAALSVTSVARADVVTVWNNAALDAIRADRTPPPQASRALAILHTSIYDAVNGISRTHEAYFVRSDVPASASKEAAASVAAHEVLVMLFAAHAATFDGPDATFLSAIANGPQKSNGIAWANQSHTTFLRGVPTTVLTQ